MGPFVESVRLVRVLDNEDAFRVSPVLGDCIERRKFGVRKVSELPLIAARDGSLIDSERAGEQPVGEAGILYRAPRAVFMAPCRLDRIADGERSEQRVRSGLGVKSEGHISSRYRSGENYRRMIN